MKCANCGAQLKVGCIYCSVCGHEAQIVPDYNILEDDYLKTLIEEQEEKKNPQKKKGQNEQVKTSKKKEKYVFPIVVSVAVICIIAALIVVTAVRRQRDNSFDYQYAQGILSEQSGDYERAVTYLLRALELDENNISVMMELAKIYQRDGNEMSEEAILLQILLLDTEHEEAYEMLIRLYDSQQKYGRITELYESLKDTPLKKLFYDYLVVSPEFSEEEGTYEEEMEVEITANDGCIIYYSFGDTDPVTNGRVYERAIPIMEGETVIRAVAKDERGIYSDVVSAKYKVEFVAPDAPTAIPASGSYTTPQLIMVMVPRDCVVYYTWDGTTPTESSMRYEGALEMPIGNNVLSLLAVNEHGLSSRVVKYNYIYLPE